MSTATLGAAVGAAHVTGAKKLATVFDTDEPGWFIVVTPSGQRLRRRREQIEWRSPKTKSTTPELKESP